MLPADRNPVTGVTLPLGQRDSAVGTPKLSELTTRWYLSYGHSRLLGAVELWFNLLYTSRKVNGIHL